jgi:phosphomannomutase
MLPPIQFGTEGWRAPIGRGPTFLQAGRIAAAVVDWLHAEGWAKRPVAVGYDTRLLSRPIAEEVARVIAARGLPVRIASHYLPTPALSFMVTANSCAAGVMVTASHNAPNYTGLKVKTSRGSPVSEAAAEWIATRANELAAADLPPLTTSFATLQGAGQIVAGDDRRAYLANILRCVGEPPARRFTYSLLASAMRGAAQGLLPQAFADRNLNISEIEKGRDVTFGGRKPEPIPGNIGVEEHAQRHWDRDVVFITDGDGDRLAALDERGRFVSSHDLFAVLLRHLVEEKGLRGEVLHAVNMTRMIPAMAHHYGLPERQLPVGFKHVAEAMITGDVLIGGEEAGGFGIKGYLPERDAIYAALLVAEAMWARRQFIGTMVAELRDEFGAGPYRRRDIEIEGDPALLRARLAGADVAELAGHRVTDVNCLDGVRLTLDDTTWVLGRISGTEPLARIYCEAAPGGDPDPVIAAFAAWLFG